MLKGVSYRSREDEIRAYVQDYWEEHDESPEAIDVGEMFNIRLDDLEIIEKHIRQYDAEGNYWIGGITNASL